MSTILAEIVAFAIVIFVIWRYVVPPVKNLMHNREKQIQAQIDDANKARTRLEDAEAQYQKTVKEAEEEAARIRDDARADAERIGEEMRRAAEEEVERIRRRGEEALENNRLQAVRELRDELGGHSVSLAEQIVRRELSSDEAKAASIDSVIEEIERAGSGSTVDTASR